MTIDRVALELYTVREETARDFAGTMRRVAQIGYKAVEFASYGNLAADEMAAILAETGLSAAATHVRLLNLENNLQAELDYCEAIGCRYMVLPWLEPARRDVASFRALAPRLNEIGRECRERGIIFGYHNHYFEFERSDGVYLLDLLLDQTDPDLVALELDIYWAAYAGVDPIGYLRRRAGRVPLLHVKDMAADRSFAEVGAGTMNLAAILSAAEEAGTKWYIVEHDQPPAPALESARRSLENLRALVKL